MAGHKEAPKVYVHHPECHSSKCARRADRLYNKHRERERKRREARELAEGWAIPAEIVRCESDFTNEAPNYAGAAGYYQLTEYPSKSAGLPVRHYAYANEATKAEQGIVARHLYNEQGTAPWVSSEPCWG